MNQVKTTTKRLLITLTVLVQTVCFGGIGIGGRVAADDPACPVTTGTQSPTGSSAIMFVFNPTTCLWESQYYTWSNVTKVYTPTYDPGPVYNPDTDSWDYINWEFVSTEGKYVMRTFSAPASIAEQIAQGDPPPTQEATIDSGNGTDSTNTITDTNSTDATINNTNNTSVLTSVDSTATSGDSNALFNTTVGNVGTGDATTTVNILNMIQSGWDPVFGDIRLFSADLYSNYFGDLLFDPSVVLGNGTNSLNTINGDTSHNLVINDTDNATIENDLTLNATSGNATANGNTTVGNVSTGDANAIADVINMINSSIYSGQSFIGSINLYGDLNGDILLPSFLQGIYLGNGTDATNAITDNTNNTLSVDSTTNNSISTNTNLTADSGLAVANNNTTAGDISTGDATTNVNQINLIGQNVQGSKGLLVFVNVLGSWYGMLFGPANISSGNGTNSTNTIADNSDTNVDVNLLRNYSIVNNLNLNATSGNATANGNTNVGDVSSGDATSSVNLLNMIGSNLNFDDWFGVLFINVFGSWNGSFGINTAAGNAPVTSPTVTTAVATTSGGLGGGPPVTPGFASNFVNTGQVTDNTNNTSSSTATLAAAHNVTKGGTTILPPLMSPKGGLNPNFVWSAGGITIGFLLLGLERYLALRKR